MSAEQISDRSKANHLAKSIICLQALWYCTQFFARLGTGLPLLLLELNTLAHSICALLIYFLWWQKPLDIEEPTVLRTATSDAYRDFCALGLSSIEELTAGWGNPLYWHHWKIVNKKHGKESEVETITQNAANIRSTGTYRGRICGIQNRVLPTQRFTNYRPQAPSFKGIDNTRLAYSFTSYDPPVIQLKRSDHIPGTTYKVGDQFESRD